MTFRGTIGAMGSHFPILAGAVAATTGPVLELGCGDWSTPMLHYMCKALGRELLTIETNATWLERFTQYRRDERPGHALEARKDWSGFNGDSPWSYRWGCAFVDCAPGEERPFLIETLRGKADMIVVHDTERDHDVGSVVRYDLISASFKYAVEFRRFRPYTMVLSDVMPFEVDACDREWFPPENWDEIKRQK